MSLTSSQNTGSSSRSATATFTTDDGAASAAVTVTQSQPTFEKPGDISVNGSYTGCYVTLNLSTESTQVQLLNFGENTTSVVIEWSNSNLEAVSVLYNASASSGAIAVLPSSGEIFHDFEAGKDYGLVFKCETALTVTVYLTPYNGTEKGNRFSVYLTAEK